MLSRRSLHLIFSRRAALVKPTSTITTNTSILPPLLGNVGVTNVLNNNDSPGKRLKSTVPLEHNNSNYSSQALSQENAVNTTAEEESKESKNSFNAKDLVLQSVESSTRKE